MEQKLKEIITIWLNSGVEERSLYSFKEMFYEFCIDEKGDVFENTDPNQLWDELLARNWLRSGVSGLCGLSPRAVSFADKTSDRLSITEANDIVADILEKVHQWNDFATINGLPSIAAVSAWGSYANPNKTDYGDIDLCVLWRFGKPLKDLTSVTPPCECDLTDVWDIEDSVDKWIFDRAHVNVSGIDQWEEFGKQDDFFNKILFQDDLIQENDFSQIRECEANVYRLYTTVGLKRKCKI